MKRGGRHHCRPFAFQLKSFSSTQPRHVWGFFLPAGQAWRLQPHNPPPRVSAPPPAERTRDSPVARCACDAAVDRPEPRQIGSIRWPEPARGATTIPAAAIRRIIHAPPPARAGRHRLHARCAASAVRTHRATYTIDRSQETAVTTSLATAFAPWGAHKSYATTTDYRAQLGNPFPGHRKGQPPWTQTMAPPWKRGRKNGERP